MNLLISKISRALRARSIQSNFWSLPLPDVWPWMDRSTHTSIGGEGQRPDYPLSGINRQGGAAGQWSDYY